MALMAITDGAGQPEEPASGAVTGNSFSGDSFFHRIDWLSFGITTAAALGVYLRTIAPEVTLEDGGTFVTGAAYAGVPDCPGFPVWTVYSWFFVKLVPFSNIAWRVTAGSALAAALACGLTALMVSRGGTLLLENNPAFGCRKQAERNLLRVVCGCVAGLALGMCEAIWRQVALLNIWALSTVLFAAMLSLLMRWTAAPRRKGFLYAAISVFGVLLTNSQSWLAIAPGVVLWVMLGDPELGRELFLGASVLAVIGFTTGLLPFFASFGYRNLPLLIAFAPAAIWAVVTGVKTRRFGSEWKPALACGVLFLAGLGPYLYPPLASMSNPPLNWAYPRTVEGFYHLVTRGQYDRLDPTHDLGQFMTQLGVFAQEIGRQFGWLYLIFIPLPFCFLRRARRGARHWMLGLTAIFVCTGPVLVAMLNPTRDRTTQQLIEPYFSAMYVVLAVWTGLGLMTVGTIVAKTQRSA
jgi:hypothetical protein